MIIQTRGREVVESEMTEGLSIIKTNKPKPVMEYVPDRTIKVAAYCRVSKDIVQQESSFETQKAAFERTISEHPGWSLAAIYADEYVPRWLQEYALNRADIV